MFSDDAASKSLSTGFASDCKCTCTCALRPNIILVAATASCRQMYAVQPEMIMVFAHKRLLFASEMVQVRGILSLQFKSSSCLQKLLAGMPSCSC